MLIIFGEIPDRLSISYLTFFRRLNEEWMDSYGNCLNSYTHTPHTYIYESLWYLQCSYGYWVFGPRPIVKKIWGNIYIGYWGNIRNLRFLVAFFVCFLRFIVRLAVNSRFVSASRTNHS